MSEPLRMRIVYEDGGNGWIKATIPEVPGVITQGRTRAEARANALDALALMLRPDPETPLDDDAESEALTLAEMP